MSSENFISAIYVLGFSFYENVKIYCFEINNIEIIMKCHMS